MNGHSLKTLWAEGQAAVQGWDMTGNPEVCAVLAAAGYDAVVIDWQHGVGVNEHSVVECIRAINSVSGVAALVRVPKLDSYYIGHALDAGAAGVIVPMINSGEEARQAGLACRYAPHGCRSFGNTPFKEADESLQTYVERANQEIICLVMIETRAALADVDAICRAEHIDGIYVGPFDLSLNMQVRLRSWPEDPLHLEAFDKILKAAKQAGIVVGHHGMNPECSAEMVKRGALLCQVGHDTTLLAVAAQRALHEYHAALEKP